MFLNNTMSTNSLVEDGMIGTFAVAVQLRTKRWTVVIHSTIYHTRTHSDATQRVCQSFSVTPGLTSDPPHLHSVRYIIRRGSGLVPIRPVVDGLEQFAHM